MLKRIFLKFLIIFLISNLNASAADVIELNEDNWTRMLENEWMVEFFAPWCPACKSLSPIWNKFAESVSDDAVKVAKIDVTKSPSLSGRFFVTALPTIYHVFNGEFRQYRGSRETQAFTTFIQNEQWKKLEPLSAWKQPNSFHMSLLSYFFKLSHYLKDLNTQLHEEYGLPSWGAYALFAIATIFFGAILGLILVCIVDFLYPPKKSQRQSFTETKQLNKSDVEYVEDLEDEEAGGDVDAEENYDDETSDGEKLSQEEEESGDDVPESEKKVEEINDSGDGVIKTNDKSKEDEISNEENNSNPKPEVRKRKQKKAD